LTSFVGREREVHELVQLLSRSRLVSLVGPPGVGKTRLALQAANSLVGKHDHGVWLIELATLHDPELVPQAVAAVVTSREQPGRLLLDSLVAELRVRNVLLVLDNSEHLLDAVASVVDALVRHCPGVRVLVTSRERLRLAGELIVQVSPLSVPELNGPISPHALRHCDAVHLFTERAVLVQPNFSVTPANALIRVAMMGLAAVAAAQGRPRRALRLEAASLALKQKWELHTGPAGSPLDSTFARFLDPARQALDHEARAKAAVEARRMTDEQAIEYALSDRE
jgi:non-specific serine/threonine protein kinase